MRHASSCNSRILSSLIAPGRPVWKARGHVAQAAGAAADGALLLPEIRGLRGQRLRPGWGLQSPWGEYAF